MNVYLYSSDGRNNNSISTNDLVSLTPKYVPKGKAYNHIGNIAEEDLYLIEIRQRKWDQDEKLIQAIFHWKYVDKDLRNKDFERITDIIKLMQ